MKKHYLLLMSLALPCIFAAQPTINNAEDFTIGTVLKFRTCDASALTAGNSGPNQVWDFSNVVHLPDTITEWMLHPSATTYGSNFPTANLVEKYSDGRYVYVNKTANENYVVGYIDTTQEYPPTHYTNPLLFAKRPINYGDIITDSFAMSNASTPGSVTLTADAYGTLILPTGTYSNVLRLKLSITHMFFSAESYIWFDGINASALLKLENNTSFEYLISETTPTSINKNSLIENWAIYPNPCADQFYLKVEQKGKLVITDMCGKIVHQVEVENGSSLVSVPNLCNGIYFTQFTGDNNSIKSKLIIKK